MDNISNNNYTHGTFPVWVHFQGQTSFANKTSVITDIADKDAADKEVMSWGDNNQLCDDREELIEKNNIVPQLLQTKRNALYGGGVFTYRNPLVDGKRKIEEVDDEEVTEALEELDESNFWEGVTNDFAKNSLAYARFQIRGNEKWSVKYIKARYVRPEKQNDDGEIDHFYVCGDWDKAEKVTRVASYQQYKNRKAAKKKTPTVFIHRVYDDFLGDEYFPLPIWSTGIEWIEIGNKIPKYFNEFLKNAYFTPLHVSIPKNYFFDEGALQKGEDAIKKARKAETEARKKFLKDIDNVLAGAENAGKSVWSEYFISHMQKEYGGIKFTELNLSKTDSGILDLFDKTNEANISGTGVHPALAAIITKGGLSSGSEIRNALDMFIITQAILQRKQILKFASVLKKLNNWDTKLKFNFRDVQLTTTDKNPTGSQNVTAN